MRGDIEQCGHIINSAVQNRQWETEDGMPEPKDAER